MRVLVTGGSGFIGSAVCRELSRAGRAVVGTIRRGTIRSDLTGIDWLECDLTEAESLQHAPAVDAVVHTAAVLPTVSSSAVSPSSSSASIANWRIDQNVFDFAAHRRLPLVYASAASIYAPSRDARKLVEDDLADPPSSYVAEKLWADLYGLEWAACTGASFVSMRICAPYGPGQRARTVMNIFLERAVRGEPLHYHGTGTREQTFTYVDDVARALVAGIGHASGVFIISGSRHVTMRELASLVAGAAGRDPVELVQQSGMVDPQEGRKARFSSDAAFRAFGWRALISLEDGVDRCVKSLVSS